MLGWCCEMTPAESLPFFLPRSQMITPIAIRSGTPMPTPTPAPIATSLELSEPEFELDTDPELDAALEVGVCTAELFVGEAVAI